MFAERTDAGSDQSSDLPLRPFPELEWLEWELLFTLSSLPLLELEGLEELRLELEELELEELELEALELEGLEELEELELEGLEELRLELEELELEELEELELEELGLEVLELGELLLLLLELGELVLLVLELVLELEELVLLDFALVLFPLRFFLFLAISCCSPSRVNRKGLELDVRGASVLACWTAMEGTVAAVARTRATARRCAIHSARLGDFIRLIELTVGLRNGAKILQSQHRRFVTESVKSLLAES